MPAISEHQSTQSTKLLFLGDSGMGKSGALAALAVEGYNLRILDFDNGLDILRNALKPGVEPYKLSAEASAKAMSRVRFVTCTDKFKSQGTAVIPTTAVAWAKAIKNLENFDGDLGNIHTWGSQDVLVIDSLNFAGRAAMRLIASLNNRLAQAPYQSDYLDAQRLVDGLLSMLYSDEVRCNLIVNSHIKEVGRTEDRIGNSGKVERYTDPSTLKSFAETGTGRALSPTVGRFFNACLQADMTGTGSAAKRIIRTEPNGNLALKTPIPKGLPGQMPIETGLATFFKAVRS